MYGEWGHGWVGGGRKGGLKGSRGQGNLLRASDKGGAKGSR